MANYLITPCNGETPFTIDGNEFTLNIGDTYFFTFSGEVTQGCFTVDSESTDTTVDIVASLGGPYVDCLSCYQDNEWSYFVSACTVSELIGPISAVYFYENPLNKFYLIEGPFWEGQLCFNVFGVSNEDFFAPFNVLGSYENCSCEGIPRSANTETELCVVCSGETSSVIPPHAVYTDAQGIAVTQLNTVALGGPDGLNN